MRAKLNRGLAWVSLSSSYVGVLDILAVVLLLKYFLSQGEYGIATTVVTLFGALELAAELGLSAAVIQRDDLTQERLSTAFWLNIAIGALIYGLIWIAAPAMGALHDEEAVTALFRAYGLNVLLRSVYTTHQALLKRELRFREWSIVRVLANVVGFTVLIATAASGASYWCFVYAALSRSGIYAIGLPLWQGWRPSLVLRIRDTADYIKFGLRASGSQILFQLYSNIDYQVVGVFFGKEAVGAYRAAYELVLDPVKFLSEIVMGIAFPAFSRLKTNMAAVVDQFIAFTRQNLVAVLGFVAIILVAAEELLVVIFRPEYVAEATAARIFAVVGVLRSLSYIKPPLLDGLGRPELTLRYQAVAAVVLTGLFIAFATVFGDRLGALSVAIAWAVGYPIAFAALLAMVFSLVDLDLRTYLRRIAGIPLCVAIACAAGLAVRWSLPADWAMSLRLAILVGVVITVGATLLAIYEGIHPAAIIRAIRSKDEDKKEDAPPPADTRDSE
jgi:O-antigen/teichoic acid export membrane protein